MSDLLDRVPDEVRKNILRKRGLLRKAFEGSAGEAALQVLRDMFEPDDLVGKTVEDTYRRIGQRDVIKHIELVLRGDE
jgi:hypothetical protein